MKRMSAGRRPSGPQIIARRQANQVVGWTTDMRRRLLTPLRESAMLRVSSNMTVSRNKRLIEEALGRFPPGWRLGAIEPWEPMFDGAVELRAPDGRTSRFVFEIKQAVEPRDVDRVATQLSRLPSGSHPLLLAPYLSPRSRDLLRDRGISHADGTGNLWIAADSVYVERAGSLRGQVARGAHADEERTPRRSLRGPSTARVVRYLCDGAGPPRVRAIASATGVDPGSVSRIMHLLEREAFVRRENLAIVEVDWKALIVRWGEDLAKDRVRESYLAPRGLDHVSARLRNVNFPYALTGSSAAAAIAPAAAVGALDVYVEDIDIAARALALREGSGLGNVRLIEAFDPVVFERTMERDGLVLAAPSQVAADLVTLPRRSADELAAMLEWMEQNAHG
jgi:hypothetical protein